MSEGNRRKIIRLLGVGFDAEDGHIRISQGERYDVLLGSDESHEYMRNLIQEIESTLDKQGKRLDEVTPGEVAELIESIRLDQEQRTGL